MLNLIKKYHRLILATMAIGFGVFIMFFLITCTWIGMGVEENCKEAKSKYSGDCVEALTQLLDDENNTNRSRNDAIWTLGQLGDKRALPTLRKYYTGNIPDREPYDETISQYELKKAINLVDGGFNMAALVWRQQLSIN